MHDAACLNGQETAGTHHTQRGRAGGLQQRGSEHCGGPLQRNEQKVWSLQQTNLAIATDSELILRGCNNVTDAVAQLNRAGATQKECYVYSEFKKKWYLLKRGQAGWSLQCTQEAVVVEDELILPHSQYVQEAVEMLNRGACDWPHDRCYVFSAHKNAWYKLWAS